MINKPSLLSTVSLPESIIKNVIEAGLEIDCIPFIDIHYLSLPFTLADIIEYVTKKTPFVFTSANAVKAVSGYLNHNNDFNIYCIGQNTLNTVTQYCNEKCVKGCADNAEKLADIIIENNEKDIVFFCGDKRMDTLPQKLQSAGIDVEEIKVYETIETPTKLTKNYTGILFFSPSGVNSYFSINTILPETLLFAIGNTTAKAIEKRTTNKVIVCKTASKMDLINEAIKFLNLSKYTIYE